MKNSDLPAMPTGLVDEDVFNSDGEFCGTVEAKYVGLTKREHFAGLAMASLIGKAESRYDYGDAADDAINFADALLTELDKEQGE